LDVMNVGNLINKDWGRIQYNSPYGDRVAVGFQGVDAATGRYIYDFNRDAVSNSNRNGVASPVWTDWESRWSLQPRLRYKFRPELAASGNGRGNPAVSVCGRGCATVANLTREYEWNKPRSKRPPRPCRWLAPGSIPGAHWTSSRATRLRGSRTRPAAACTTCCA